jgi:UDP-GlcNAc:undecaprenyl-phosphate GlcNAc-1-phosphate transferase
MREYALVLLVTAAVTYLLVPFVRRFAIATGAIPELRARDVHTEPTPRLGGLAMFGGLVAGLLVASRLTNLQDPFQAAGSRTQSGLLLAGGLIVVIGFIDDRWGLSAVSKLAGQVAAAGILVWSGQALPWLPSPNGHEMVLEPDLSVTLTILLVVVTINAINFIDGMDGLAAGIVAVTAIGFLVYSYSLVNTLKIPTQSLPAVSSALLAGMCIGFLPHNFYPARIFMGDTGAMLLGLLLAYGPISSTGSLDDAVLVNYAQNHPFNRFATFLPLLVPAAIFLIPYTDLMLAVIRRTRRGKSLMAADREHLHHRLMNIGHSYRQSVLIMWLWAALLSATVVALSLVRTHLWVLAVATFAAVLLLLPVTMPSVRPWRLFVRDTPVPAPASPVQVPAPPPAQEQPGSAPGAAAGWHAEADRARIAPASAFAGAPVSGRRAEPAGPPDGFGAGSVDELDRGPVDGFGGAPVGTRGRRAAVPGGPPPGFEPVPAPPDDTEQFPTTPYGDPR